MQNIGLGGAGILSDSGRLAPGDSVSIALMTPGVPGAVVLPARIAWIATAVSPPRPAGVAFQHGGPEAALALYKLLLAYDPSA